jgi:predicted solute-binding protein
MAAVWAVFVLALLTTTRALKIPEQTSAIRVTLGLHNGRLLITDESPVSSGERRGPDTRDLAAVVVNRTDRSVTFTQWYGRIGNNIVQIANAILFSQLKGYSTLRLPEAVVKDPQRPRSTIQYQRGSKD